jgi:hypothetical protein
MYENLINQIMLWDRKLAFENELRISRVRAAAVEESTLPSSCQVKCKTIFTWNYKFEKDYQPLFNGLSQDCIAISQPC